MRRRAVLIGVAGVLVLLAGLLDLSGATRVNPFVAPAEAAAGDVAQTTTGVYVSLRIINSALSAAQEVEVGASVGAQVGVQPLKVLEPVDDTVERVADVVFAVAAGAALAWVGLAPVAGIGLVLLGIGLLGRCGSEIWPGASPLCRTSRRAVGVGAALGLVLPLVFALGVSLGQWLTQPQWREAMATLDRVTAEAAVLIGSGGAEEIGETVTEEAGGTGLLQSLGDRLSSAGAAVGGAAVAVDRYTAAMGVFLSEAEALFTASLTLIGIFALRMLVLPALLLWGSMTVLRHSLDG
jgi:hypothetical protein